MANYITTLLLGALLVGRTISADAADPAAPAPAAAATKYQQANAGSSLSFTFTQLGAASSGQFKTFATELRYDEAHPEQGSLVVRVMIDSLDTQDGERDGTLKSADLFDAKKYPAATFAANTLTRTAAGGLEAVGKLTIRGMSKDLRLPFTLKPTANGLELSGQTTIKRLDFGVGQGEWKSTESVGDEVKIEYRVALVKATR
jgi:polyisoprenoid-binding protein YceI